MHKLHVLIRDRKYIYIQSRDWVSLSGTDEPLHTSWAIIFNPFTAKWFNLNFHPLKVVFRWRDPQLQVSENYSDLTKCWSTLFTSCCLMSHFIFNIYLKCGTSCVNKKWKTWICSALAVKGLIKPTFCPRQSCSMNQPLPSTYDTQIQVV